jgi:acyl carrier protein
MAAEMFEADVDAVSVASTPNDLEGWDSLAMLNLLVALEDEYGISLPPDDFGAATTIDGIVTIVAAHLG